MASNFESLIEQIKLHFNIDNHELCERLGLGPVNLDNYMSGYVAPPAELLEKLGKTFSVAQPAGEPDERLTFAAFPGGTLSPEHIAEALDSPRRFLFPVSDDLLAKLKVFDGSLAIIELCAEPKSGDHILASIDRAPALLYKLEDGEPVTLRRGEDVSRFTCKEFQARVRVAGKLVGAIEKF